MATIKSYTDIEQSRKLAEILPLESADGFWYYSPKWYSEGDDWEGYEDYPRAEPYLEYTRKENEWKEDKSDVPCWSLSALLNVLPQTVRLVGTPKDSYWYCECVNGNNQWYAGFESADNPIDACYKMIIRLNEQKKL